MTNTHPRSRDRNGPAKEFPATISTQIEQDSKDALGTEQARRATASGKPHYDEAPIVREALRIGLRAMGYGLPEN